MAMFCRQSGIQEARFLAMAFLGVTLFGMVVHARSFKKPGATRPLSLGNAIPGRRAADRRADREVIEAGHVQSERHGESSRGPGRDLVCDRHLIGDGHPRGDRDRGWETRRLQASMRASPMGHVRSKPGFERPDCRESEAGQTSYRHRACAAAAQPARAENVVLTQGVTVSPMDADLPAPGDRLSLVRRERRPA